jgi:hypothetical protein
MAIWTILPASTALGDVKPEYKDILQNRAILSVNQDELGIQGRRVNNTGLIDICTRPISPMLGDDYSYAVAFVNHRTDGYPYLKSITLAEIGLTNARGYDFQDLYNQNMKLQTVGPDSVLSVRINPSGVVFCRACRTTSTLRFSHFTTPKCSIIITVSRLLPRTLQHLTNHLRRGGVLICWSLAAYLTLWSYVLIVFGKFGFSSFILAILFRVSLLCM